MSYASSRFLVMWITDSSTVHLDDACLHFGVRAPHDACPRIHYGVPGPTIVEACPNANIRETDDARTSLHSDRPENCQQSLGSAADTGILFASSCIPIVAAAAAFREETRPRTGIATRKSHDRATSGRIPLPSPPTTIAARSNGGRS